MEKMVRESGELNITHPQGILNLGPAPPKASSITIIPLAPFSDVTKLELLQINDV